MRIIKTIHIIFLALFLAINCCATSASSGEIVYEDENISVMFSENTKYTTEEQKIIADQLIYGSEEHEIVPYNILCDIFGHDFSTEYIQIIQHKVDDLAPRCLKKTYEARGCSICHYIEYDLFSMAYIDCCPEE